MEQFGSDARAKWVRMQESVVSGGWPCVNAHVVSRGAGGKAEDIVPLTAEEHRELHEIGIESFEAKYGVDLAECARRIDERWRKVEAA